VRSRPRISAGVLTIVAIVLLALGPAVASAHSGKNRALRLVATRDQMETLDLGTTGPSLGDELIFSEVLRENGRQVGTSGVVCTITAVEPPYEVVTYHCVGTLSLRRGQITLQALIEAQGPNDMGPWDVAITGGTGAFRGAGGQATYRLTSDTRAIYTLRFDSKDSKKRSRHR
jgi:hypothetical protein